MVVVVPCASPAVRECVCVDDGDAILVGLCVEAGEVWVHGQEYTGRVVVFLSKIFLVGCYGDSCAPYASSSGSRHWLSAASV